MEPGPALVVPVRVRRYFFLSAHLDQLGLKNFEFAKPFLLIDALHGRARSLRDQPRRGHWLAWLDHDVWPHPETAFSEVGSRIWMRSPVRRRSHWAIFSSLNTGVLFAGRAGPSSTSGL